LSQPQIPEGFVDKGEHEDKKNTTTEEEYNEQCRKHLVSLIEKNLIKLEIFQKAKHSIFEITGLRQRIKEDLRKLKRLTKSE
jgi:hypothetical protein